MKPNPTVRIWEELQSWLDGSGGSCASVALNGSGGSGGQRSRLGLFGLVDLVGLLVWYFWLFYCTQKDFQMELWSKMNIQMNWMIPKSLLG